MATGHTSAVRSSAQITELPPNRTMPSDRLYPSLLNSSFTGKYCCCSSFTITTHGQTFRTFLSTGHIYFGDCVCGVCSNGSIRHTTFFSLSMWQTLLSASVFFIWFVTLPSPWSTSCRLLHQHISYEVIELALTLCSLPFLSFFSLPL